MSSKTFRLTVLINGESEYFAEIAYASSFGYSRREARSHAHYLAFRIARSRVNDAISLRLAEVAANNAQIPLQVDAPVVVPVPVVAVPVVAAPLSNMDRNINTLLRVAHLQKEQAIANHLACVENRALAIAEVRETHDAFARAENNYEKLKKIHRKSDKVQHNLTAVNRSLMVCDAADNMLGDLLATRDRLGMDNIAAANRAAQQTENLRLADIALAEANTVYELAIELVNNLQ